MTSGPSHRFWVGRVWLEPERGEAVLLKAVKGVEPVFAPDGSFGHVRVVMLDLEQAASFPVGSRWTLRAENLDVYEKSLPPRPQSYGLLEVRHNDLPALAFRGLSEANLVLVKARHF